MTDLRPTPSAARAGRLVPAFGLLGILALAVGSAHTGLAQCTLQSGPTAFVPQGTPPPAFLTGRWGDISLYNYQGDNRLLVRESFGYSTYTLSNPGAPRVIGWHNMLNEIPKRGDGQFTVTSLGIAPDGGRAVVNWYDALNGNFTMGPSGGVYNYGGDYGSYRATGGVAVVKRGSDGKYLGFSLYGYGLYGADITTLVPNNGVYPYSSTNPNHAIEANSIPSARVTGASVSAPASGLQRAGTFVFFLSGGEVQLFNADGFALGSGATLFSNLTTTSVGATQFGGNSAMTVAGVAGALDPGNPQKLWLVGVLASGTTLQGFGIVDVDFSSGSPVLNAGGTHPLFVPGYPYSGPGTYALASAGAVTGNNDVAFFVWGQDSTTSRYRLWGGSALTWPSVGPPLVDAAVNDYGGFRTPEKMVGLQSGSTTYLYIGQGLHVYSIAASCAQAPTATAASLSVVRCSDPANDATCTETISDGQVTPAVFIGDKLKVKLGVSPAPVAGQATQLSGWRFDYDLHASETVGSYPRLVSADQAGGSGSTPPAALPLLGPCDPRNGQPTPGDGTGCWASVVGNTSTGGAPDFLNLEIPKASEGTSQALGLGFEAANQLGSANLAQFTVRWTVPRVKVKVPQVKTGTVTLVDGSEGKPATTGYKWYFAGTPNTPASAAPLVLDTTCTGPTCVHTFSQQGSYDYWLTVPYRNGYVSQDCPGAALNGGTGKVECSQSFQTIASPLPAISVTDAVLDFTVPSSVNKTSTSVTVTSASDVANGVYACPSTSSGFSYEICDATASGSCPTGATGPGTGSGPLTFTGGTGKGFTGGTASVNLPAPASGSYPATFWLRIKYTYAYDASCTSPRTQNWLPTSSPDPQGRAYAINVTDITWNPQIRIFVNGADPCAGGAGPGGGGTCDGFSAMVGDTLTAWAYDAATLSAIPASAGTFSWNFGANASPASGSVNGASFSYSQYGNKTVQLSFTPAGQGPLTLSVNGTVTTNAPALSASASANPSSAAVNQAISFSCSASGGTGGYSYSWSFSDGGSATGQSVSKSFSTAGNYNGTCTVRDSQQTTRQASAYVTVTSGGGTTVTPEIHVWVNGADPCAGSGGGGPGGGGTGGGSCSYSYFNARSNDDVLTAYAFNKSTGYALSSGSFQWNFGTGANPATATSSSASFRYTAAGNVQVTLTYTPPGGSPATATVTGTITQGGPPAPTLVISATPNPGYPGNAVAFNGQVGSGSGTYTSFEWNFGDNTPVVSQATLPATHTYASIGSYPVSCKVTDSNGTTKTATLYVSIVAPPVPPMWMVPGAAFVDGQNGAIWQSDLSIFNPGNATMNLRAAFLDGTITKLDQLDGKWKDVSLPPHATLPYRNVLSSLFGLPKGSAGSILIQHKEFAPATLPVMSGRTYDSSRGASGTVGLSLSIVSLGGSSSSGSGGPGGGAGPGGLRPQPEALSGVYHLVGLSQDDRSYTNLGFANLGSDYVTAEVRFRDPSGAQLGAPVTIQLNPYGVKNLSNVLEAPPPAGAGYAGSAHVFRASVQLTAGTSLFPYASVIDRTSKAPSLLTPPTTPEPAYRVPAVIRTPGINDTVWKSSVTVFNTSTRDRYLDVSYTYTTSSAPQSWRTISQIVPIRAGETLSIDDFVAYWLGLSAGDTQGYYNSFLDFVPADSNSDPIVVTAQAYNDQPTGKVGLGVPGFGATDGVSTTTSNHSLILAGLRSDDSYRSNVAFFLTDPEASSFSKVGATAAIYGANGVKLGEVAFQVSPFQPFVQFSVDSLDFVKNAAPEAKSSMTMIVDRFDGPSLVAGYATVIDNQSGGSTLTPAEPAP